METRKIVWIALLGLAFWGFQLTASPALADPPGQQPDPVVVTNTDPIPVLGTVDVGNFPVEDKEIVTLHEVPGGGDCQCILDATTSFVRVLDNGTVVNPFRVPEGKWFVATDVEWVADVSSPPIVTVLYLKVVPETLLSNANGDFVYASKKYVTTEVAVFSDRFSTGFAVGPGTKICAPCVFPGFPNRASEIFIRGYLE
jgi:hypothetical protein